jgi:hypothetical protein
MKVPSWNDIQAEWREAGYQRFLALPGSNPNARLFKVYWRLFTRHSPWEGQAFLARARPTCTYYAEWCIERCRRFDEPVWLYPFRLPRWDPDVMPWDLTHPRWRDVQRWAPAFDEDPDPLTEQGYR